jgi:hypothetical protein
VYGGKNCKGSALIIAIAKSFSVMVSLIIPLARFKNGDVVVDIPAEKLRGKGWGYYLVKKS